jgi:DNA helicase-2/ATP-dependent DNA helicase PcrA
MKSRLIIAGPGTGKTQRIIELVSEYLQNNDSNNSGFILCTFTRKAAEELQIRLYEKIDFKLLSEKNFLIDTIHSICLSLLKLHPEGKFSEFEVIPEDEISSFINGKLPRLGFDRDKLSGPELWNLCSEIGEIYGYITDQSIDTTAIEFTQNEKLDTIINGYGMYLKLLSHDKKFDFALVQKTLKDEIETNTEFRNLVNARYNMIFVDEYQDINLIQHKLLLSMLLPSSNMVAVGDDDQAIYGFRGASVEHLLKLPNDLRELSKNVHVEKLEANHRSVDEIVALSQEYIKHSALVGFKKKIKSVRGNCSVKPIVYEFENISEEVNAITENINALISSKNVLAFCQIAILLRSAKFSSVEIIKSLNNSGIPSKLIGVGDFFDITLVQEFMILIEFIVDTDLASKNNFKKSLIEFNSEIASYYSETKIDTEIIKIKDQWRNYKSSIALVYDLLTAGNFFERYKMDGPNIGLLTKLVMSHDENLKGLDLYGLYSFLSYLRREKKIDSLSTSEMDAVQIMTLHKAKGLEFDAIFMPNQKSLKPQTSVVELFKDLVGISNKDNESELRLFYVGMTRARNFLWISRSTKSLNGKKSYLPSLGFNVVSKLNKNYVTSSYFSKSFAAKATIPIQKNISKLSYNAINTYQICPKQYMYKNVWRLETARNAGMTFGSILHNALQMINAYIQINDSIKNLDLEKIMSKAWKSNWRVNEKENLKFRNNAFDQLQDYRIIGIEKQFNISVNDILISGRYDLVLKNATEVLIVDFKSGDERNYSFQMSFYEYCLSKEILDTDIKSKIYYLNSGKFSEVETLSTTSVLTKISDTKNLLEKGIYSARPGKHCQDCAFNKICEESLNRFEPKV